MPDNRVIEGRLALLFATISRPNVVQRLVLSVRKHFPTVQIYIADQSHRSARQEEFYAENNCQVVWMDHDAGVCASRNAAVDLVKEPYFVLCDDDFILTEDTDFVSAITVLDADPGIGVVGGRLIDIYENAESGVVYKEQRFWELHFHYDPDKGNFVTIPVHYLAPYPKMLEGVRFFECDAVMNFAVFRTDMFDNMIRWDPRFKSNGEHEDFYLNLKMNGKHRVVYTPKMVALHHHPPLHNYSRLRNRNRGWQLFFDKWQLRQCLDLDSGIRITNDVDHVRPYAMGYRDFYSSPALVSTKWQRRPETVVISNITDELVSRKQAAMFENDTSLGTDFRRFHIGQDGSVLALGGSWERLVPTTLVRSRKSSPSADNIARVQWSFDLPRAEDGWEHGDLFAYLRPSLDPVDTRTELSDVEVMFSVAKGGSYAIFRKPALALYQAIVLNVWNALAVPNSNLSGDLIVEVTVIQRERILFEESKVLFVPPSRPGAA